MRTFFIASLFVLRALTAFADESTQEQGSSDQAVEQIPDAELDHAIAKYDEAIRLNPKNAKAHVSRGLAWQRKGNIEKAIADYTESIQLKFDDPMVYYYRASALHFRGDIENAIDDYAETIRRNTKEPWPYNALAWILATVPNAKYRDGKKAIEYATTACRLTDWKDALCLDTLAAAYAESGEFKSALEYQQKAIAVAPESQKDFFSCRLRLYHDQKPFREIVGGN